MITSSISFRLVAAAVAGALLTMILASGCITHPPDTAHRPDGFKESITHPPDTSKDGPPTRHPPRRHKVLPPPMVGATPAPITHPGE